MRRPRFPLEVRVEWSVHGTLTRYRSTTRDLSDTGMLIATLASPAVGTPVELRLGVRGIPLSGSVVRIAALESDRDQGSGVAVCLDEPASAGRRRLRRYLRTPEGRDALAS